LHLTVVPLASASVGGLGGWNSKDPLEHESVEVDVLEAENGPDVSRRIVLPRRGATV